MITITFGFWLIALITTILTIVIAGIWLSCQDCSGFMGGAFEGGCALLAVCAITCIYWIVYLITCVCLGGWK